ncbi:ribonuclease domain-containing protein [Streptomyces sp. NPDC046931]|uniref:ribonuclease domain-containing protein n=1 Tax=Streptomyces sp. NPDC046931 TaxID=3154806 RepID=UPI00340CD374
MRAPRALGPRRRPARAPRPEDRAYAVPARGSREPRARRLVAGRSGEIHCTDDHYNPFRRCRDDR